MSSRLDLVVGHGEASPGGEEASSSRPRVREFSSGRALVVGLAVCLSCASPAMAQAEHSGSTGSMTSSTGQVETPPDQTQPSDPSGTAAAPTAAGGRSGYSEDLPPIEGRDGVASDLFEDDQERNSVFKFKALDGTLDPWWDFKRRLKEKAGLKLSFSYQSLRMWSDQPDEDAETFGDAGRFQFQGAWTALGRGTTNTSVVTFRMEYRDTLQGNITPTQIGGQFGSAGVVGTGFSDFQFQFRELAWRQKLYGGRWQFATGKISAVSWYNGHALSSPMRGFQNTALLASNTRAFPGRGLGLVNSVRLGQKGGIVAGIHDANAVSANDPFETIDQGEFFYSAEVRWALTEMDRRQWDQARVEVWYQNERKEAGIPSGRGVTFAVSRLFADRYYAFLVGGKSDGNASQMETDIAGGFGMGFDTRNRAARDVLAIGLSWAKPSDSSFNEQTTAELFYRFQLLQNIAFSLSTQYINDPWAGEPGDDVWVFGFKWRMTF